MGNGWSQTSYCQDEDFNMTKIDPAFSSSESSDSSDSSSESDKSSSSSNVIVFDGKPKNAIIEKENLEEELTVKPFLDVELIPPISPAIAMLERIRKATAARDEKERQIRAVTDLLNSLKSQFYQMNHELVVANQEYTRIYGENAIEHHKDIFGDESFA